MEKSVGKPELVYESIMAKQQQPLFKNSSFSNLFDAGRNPTKQLLNSVHPERFVSWISILLLLIMIQSFRSSAAPFLNPSGEPRRFASKSVYFHITVGVYLWVLSSTILTVIPHFSPSHYNVIIAAALFFPMLFSTVFSLCLGRFIVRMWFYATELTRRKKQQIQKSLETKRLLSPTKDTANHQTNGTLTKKPLIATIQKSSLASLESLNAETTMPMMERRRPMMVSFHRPFRRLLKWSALLSAVLCFVYTHCWSRDMGAFKVGKSHGAGAVCRVAFMPFDNGDGAEESSIWILWGIAVGAMLVIFFQDEFDGKHEASASLRLTTNKLVGANMSSGEETRIRSSERSLNSSELDDDSSSDLSSDDEENDAKSNGFVSILGLHSSQERPQDTLDMVPWYSVLLVASAFDILVQLKVFLGRFDARTMQSALDMRERQVETKQRNFERIWGRGKDPPFDVNNYAPGCVFECDSKRKLNSDDEEGGLWFDFMADCGDGFHSSYHVARMLAQPTLLVKDSKTTSRTLPRGEFLVIGGDLAYPDPSEENFEKRFFRTFEDAMAPPPSFRRKAISTSKPALPVKGWVGCFDETYDKNKTLQNRDDDILKHYNGPSAFIIPGNHDWYDGLSTFSRFILARDWLGGWLMPQQRSYFALKLPQGWWIFGLDLALTSDIDIDQFKFFAHVAATALKPSDAVILVTHEPTWVTVADQKITDPEQFPEKNLRELEKNHLAGKVRARLAGDLHHYTRHTPCTPRSPPPDMPKSPATLRRKRGKDNSSLRSSSTEESPPINLPELFVSGGGGAFLHGTHTFDDRISVGPKGDEYVRVAAYPSAKVCSRLSWLNMWQFRWRNWRLDIVWAICYFGVSSSLFPLCGIYADYSKYNSTHDPFYLFLWVVKTVYGLFCELLSIGRISLFFAFVIVISLVSLTDSKLKPTTRFLWGLSHGLVHLFAALACLLFVECIVEWTIDENIVKVVTGVAKSKWRGADEGIDLASSLYQEYKSHFSHIFDEISPASNIKFSSADDLFVNRTGNMNSFQQFHANAYEMMIEAISWLVKTVPLLQATLQLFDLPGTIAEKHTHICEILCADGTECLLRNNFFRYNLISRSTIVSYVGAMSLYFFILAIPLAGSIFGTWLALTLNVFKAQYDEGWSSLRIPHWKNYLKLHIKDSGDLEVFAIGLSRVPTSWVRDSSCGEFRGRHVGGDGTNNNVPSWRWPQPSKWMPQKSFKKFVPEVVDYSCIPKRPSSKAI